MVNAKIFDEFVDQFNHFLDLGKQEAENLNIAITGLCRDLEPSLQKSLDGLDRLSKRFNSCKFFIYENDSKDKTTDILKSWSNKNKNYLSEHLASTHPVGPAFKDKSRTEALSSYRNLCKDYILSNYKDIDYVFVVDLDFQTFSTDGILNTIGHLTSKNIPAMCGNAFAYYNNKFLNYDSWAYRYNWWSDLQETLYWFNFWQPPVGSEPIKVNSAFGGMCIYKSKYYLDPECKYEGYDCEHVCLHKNLYSKYSEFELYINPSQVVIL